ncbi:MAG: hypothetical protein KGV44_00645 [Flavobacteriaceae bacterium]|nr:hypothetical protein [Flavobacteriaceae bacterium]
MKFRQTALLLALIISVFSCKKDDKPHDAKKQAIEDNKAIITYLETHYLGKDGALRTIKGSEKAIKDDVKSETVTYNDIDYKLYYLTTKEGKGTKNAKDIDSVYMSFSGILLDSTVFQPTTPKNWVYLSNPQSRYITGFRKGATFFKSGVLKTFPDEYFTFENCGKGYVFMPSGLGYGNNETSTIRKNSPLIFYYEIGDVKAIKTEEK